MTDTKGMSGRIRFRKGNRGRNIGKFNDASDRFCSIVDGTPQGSQPTIWLGFESGDRMLLNPHIARKVAEVLNRFAEKGTLDEQN
ncbi:hypothetical protein LEP1GSC161_0286 [Leptospira santarosai str. CBC1416]|uniref:Uncharacterized protein n=1 Tax=Leptospira santarosai str. CBC1416 TaxID=1193059 RepID=M6VX50_9LEPT|nr:hypothetical protein LEP1GSC161_0286 [Leptospira santarosai str. CBC1416]